MLVIVLVLMGRMVVLAVDPRAIVLLVVAEQGHQVKEIPAAAAADVIIRVEAVVPEEQAQVDRAKLMAELA